MIHQFYTLWKNDFFIHFNQLPPSYFHNQQLGLYFSKIAAKQQYLHLRSVSCHPQYLHHTSSWCISSPPPAVPRDASCRCSGNSSCRICSAVGHLLASCHCAPGLQESCPPLDTLYSSQRDYAWRDDCRSTPDTSPSHSVPPLKIPVDIKQRWQQVSRNAFFSCTKRRWLIAFFHINSWKVWTFPEVELMRNLFMPQFLLNLKQDKWSINSFWKSKSSQMWVGLLMYIYLASADSTFNVAKGRYKGMPCGSRGVHLLVSFKVTTWEKGKKRKKVTEDSQEEKAWITLNCAVKEIQLCDTRKERHNTRKTEKSLQRKNCNRRKTRTIRGKRSQREEREYLPSRCSSTLSGAFMSLGSFLSEQEKGNGDIKTN